MQLTFIDTWTFITVCIIIIIIIIHGLINGLCIEDISTVNAQMNNTLTNNLY